MKKLDSYEIAKGTLAGLLGIIVSSLFAMFSLTPSILRIPFLVLMPAILFFYFRNRKFACVGIFIAYLIVGSFIGFALLAFQPAYSTSF